MENFLSILALLVCPLMMFFCMRGHSGHGHKGHGQPQDNHIDQKIQKLEEQNQQLLKEIGELKNKKMV